MNCPFCGSNQTCVDDSRSKGETVVRRRRCLTCNQLFKTFEVYADESNKFDNPVFLRLLNHYGVESQELMTIGECAELIVALRHKARKRATADEVIDEIADVIVMTQQLRIAYGAKNVDNRIAEKLARQLKRINERTV